MMAISGSNDIGDLYPREECRDADCRSHRCIGQEPIQQRSCVWKIILQLNSFLIVLNTGK